MFPILTHSQSVYRIIRITSLRTGVQVGITAAILSLSLTAVQADPHGSKSEKKNSVAAFRTMRVTVGEVSSQIDKPLKLQEIGSSVRLALYKTGFRVFKEVTDAAKKLDFIVDVNITNVRESGIDLHNVPIFGKSQMAHRTLTVNLDLTFHTPDGEIAGTALGKGSSNATSFKMMLSGVAGQAGNLVKQVSQVLKPSQSGSPSSGSNGQETLEDNPQSGQQDGDSQSDGSQNGSAQGNGLFLERVQNTDINRAVFVAINNAMEKIHSDEIVDCHKKHAAFSMTPNPSHKADKPKAVKPIKRIAKSREHGKTGNDSSFGL